MCYNIVHLTSFEKAFKKAKQYLHEVVVTKKWTDFSGKGFSSRPDRCSWRTRDEWVNLEDAGRVGEPGEDWTSGCTGRKKNGREWVYLETTGLEWVYLEKTGQLAYRKRT